MTHNPEEPLTMSDRIAVMRNGVFEQIAAKTEIYTNPATAFVAGFVGHANRFEGRLIEIAGDLARIEWKGASMLVPRPRDAAPGAPIQYSIKYEDLEVASGVNGFDPGSRNWLNGRLRDVIFKGQTANYIVVLDDGSDVIVSGAPRGTGLKPNDPVVVHWPKTRGACFKL